MQLRRFVTATGLIALLAAAPVASSLAAVDCTQLARETPGQGSVQQAQPVAAGAFSAAGVAIATLPAFCRVTATLAPSADSQIRIEVWLPLAGWNGKLLGVGNAGWTGSIAYSALAEGLRRGYAVASTDTGHEGGSASFALGHPEKVIDFGYRAVHEMTVAAKALVATYYGDAPRRAYFNGCSAGGRQGLKAAQRFPEDYDGIIAGAPAADWTGRAASALRIWQALHANDASSLAPASLAVLHGAVLEACDGRDGVVDGVVDEPQRCNFNPARLACTGTQGSDCLTRDQVEAVREVYAPAFDPVRRREIAGLYPGSEPGWATWGGGEPFAPALGHFRYLVHQDPDWSPRGFDFAEQVALAQQRDAGVIDARDANLAPYFARGGKLLQYHGWSDPQISPGNSVDYYQQVAKAQGGAAKLGDSYRLFMLPGMGHCAGGEGPDEFDRIGALERWVEQGEAPARLIASRSRGGEVDRTRPLCPYPQVARYVGKGSTDAAESFQCGKGR